MLFEHLGITGAILLFYGFVSLALTQASSWFFWVLAGVGSVCLLAFFIMALSRTWQKVIILFIVTNGLWIGLHFLLRDKEWAGKVVSVAALVLNVGFLWIARYMLQELFQSRSMRHGTSSAFYSLIVVFILIVINIGSQDFYKSFDFTAEKVNTLTDQTEKILKDVTEPLKITAFYNAQNQGRDAIRKILDLYKKLNKNVEVLVADPDQEKLLTEEKKASDGDILIEYKGQSHITKDPSEQGITQAILKVSRTNTPVICFTSGHGELSLEESEESPQSLSILKASLENEGYQPRTLGLLTDSVPTDCSVVVIAGPTQRFAEAESALFDRFLENGGKMIALLDPILPRVETQKISILPTGLENLMSKWGAKLGQNLILEKHLSLFQGVQTDLSVRSMSYGNHPIVDTLKGKQTYFEKLQSVQKASGFEGTTYELIKSAEKGNSWAESDVQRMFKEKKADVGAGDIEGPVNIAMAIERETPKKTQLFVVGDADFISNALLQASEFNYDLFLNAVNWMSGDVQNISIRPKKIKTSAIILSPEQSNMIFYVAIITLPMVVLIFGLNLWLRRRRKG